MSGENGKMQHKYTGSHAAQFTNNYIYLALLSYGGAAVKINVKFANEYGTFGMKRR